MCFGANLKRVIIIVIICMFMVILVIRLIVTFRVTLMVRQRGEGSRQQGNQENREEKMLSMPLFWGRKN